MVKILNWRDIRILDFQGQKLAKITNFDLRIQGFQSNIEYVFLT